MRSHGEGMVAGGLRLALLALAVCGGGAPSPAPEPPTGAEVPGPWAVVVLGSAAQVRPGGKVSGADAADLVAARNEFESFQVAVAAGAAPVRNLVVSAAPLVGPGGATIPVENLTVYRVDYYDVKTPSDLEGAPGRWPDPLIPAVDPLYGEARHAFPVDVPAGENRVAWIDVLVPDDAPPGVYRGTVDVAADGLATRVPVALTVLAFTLPSTASLKSSLGLSDDTCAPLGLEGCGDPDRKAEARELFLRVALDDRVTLGHPHAPWSLVGAGAGRAEFRKHFLPFVAGQANTRLRGARLTTYQVNRVSDRGLAGWKAEAERDGFVDRAFVWSCDEPFFFPVYGDPAGNWPLCRAKLERDAAAWPEVRKLVTAHIQTATDAGALALIDLLVVNLEFLDGPPGSPWYAGDQRPLYDDFLADRSRPRELWSYTACGAHGCTRNDDPYTTGWAGSFAIDAPAAETRALPWLAFSYDLGGVLYYDTVLRLGTAWDDQLHSTGNGDGTLFYPGTPARIGGTHPIPIESLRLKYLRDGFEDYEYLAFLRDHGAEADARRIARRLFPAPYDTARSDDELQAARRELAARVADLAGGPHPGR